MTGLRGRHFVSAADLTNLELNELLSFAREMKRRAKAGIQDQPLKGKSLGVLFQKPSLRTRVTFDLGMKQLGGSSLYLSPAEIGMGTREAVDDVALVLSRYFDGIATRVFSHSIVVELAENASVPVINALSDAEHPCQALADVMTIQEWRGDLKGLRVAFIGDGNNVAVSLGLLCAKTGMHFTCATPEGYRMPAEAVWQIEAEAKKTGGTLTQTDDVREAAKGANALYTDVWTSMGQEAEVAKRKAAFEGFCIDEDLLALGDDAIVLHCLPAHYGEEITRPVSRHERSAIWDQAENRLHAQKALMAMVMA